MLNVFLVFLMFILGSPWANPLVIDGSGISIVITRWISNRKIGYRPGSFPSGGYFLFTASPDALGWQPYHLELFATGKVTVMPHAPLWSVGMLLYLLVVDRSLKLRGWRPKYLLDTPLL
jgi:hypothetical protein